MQYNVKRLKLNGLTEEYIKLSKTREKHWWYYTSTED
jgi:hypothetical protein